jgi:hypothetical protein
VGSSLGNFENIDNMDSLHSSYDAFVMKLDSYGSRLWTRLFGTAGNDFALAVVVGSDDHVYITGATEGALNNQTHIGDYDIFFNKI